MSGFKEPNGGLDVVRFWEKGSYGMFLKPWLPHLDDPCRESDVQNIWMMYELRERAALGLPTWDSDADSTTDPGTIESSILTKSDCAMPEWSDSEHEC